MPEWEIFFTDWQFMLCTVLQERLDPDAMPLEGIQILHLEGHLGGNVLGLAVKAPIGHIVAGGRASHLQCRVNGLDAQRGDTVQFKILDRVPDQKASRFGSFHTSKNHWCTSSAP